MCLPICKILTFISCTICFLIIIIIGGYIGKGLYLYSGKNATDLAVVLTSSEFYVPDLTFWCIGIGFALVILIVFTALYCIAVCIFNAFKDICCYDSQPVTRKDFKEYLIKTV
jgi:polyferredoxin